MKLPSGTVTFLFTDIEGSTQLLQSQGEQYAESLAAHARIIESAVGSDGGIVVNTEGDAHFCVFRKAHDAVRAAVGIQRDLATWDWPLGGEFRVRIGIHTGEGTLGGHDYVGIDVHRAARISAAGHGGQVLLSAESFALAARLLPESVTVVDVGSFQLKGLQEPEHLYQLVIPGLVAQFPALKSLGGSPHNLPATLNSFVGRSDDLTTIEDRLRESRLITLTGPAGTGKTRLAFEVGVRVLDHFPEGVWVVELASLLDPRGVWHAMGAALRLRERPGIPPMAAVTDHLRHKAALIILDNCEHLTEACAELGSQLLSECPEVRILATSRRPIGAPAERVHQVPALAVPGPQVSPADALAFAAVQLFVDRARERNHTFAAEGDAVSAIVRICSRLDGIPLAIELAAARVQVLGPHQIADRLDDRFRLLTGGSAAAVSHHQTLRVALDWSYDLLTPHEASVLRCLSVFAGGFSFDAVESVCDAAKSDEATILDLLQGLVEQSLVTVEDDMGVVRYRLLETVRAYAAERLTSSRGEAEFQAHGVYYMQMAESAEPALQGPQDATTQADVLDDLERDHDNFRAAMTRAFETAPDIAGRLAAALWRFWEIRGYLNEGSEWLGRALAVLHDGAIGTRAKALVGAGKLAWRRGAFEDAEPLFRESLELWREIGDREGEANALHGLARAALNLGDQAAAQVWGEESLSIQEELLSKQGMATAVNTLGEIARFRGNYHEAESRYSESLRIYDEIGDTAATISVKHNLGYTALSQGDIETAEARFKEAMGVARDLRDHLGIFSVFGGLAGVAISRGDAERAAVLFGAATTVATDGYAGDRVDQLEVERYLEATKAVLESPTFDTSWDLGAQMERPAAIAFALRE